MKIKIYLTIIFYVFSSLYAQQTTDANIEVFTETIQVSNKPQIISIRINCLTTLNLQEFSLKFINTKANWNIVSASLDDESLWLIQSNEASENDKVLAWNSDKSESGLRLYPSDWQNSFSLDIEIQINLIDVSSIKIDSQDQVILDVTYNGVINECVTSGRGNTVVFK